MPREKAVRMKAQKAPMTVDFGSRRARAAWSAAAYTWLPATASNNALQRMSRFAARP